MSFRLLRLWWLSRVPPPHARLVLLLGLAIRASGILMLAFTLPAIWGHMAHPWWSALLALALTAENVAVAWWWLWQRRPDARVLWVDLPAGVAAILIGAWLAPRHAVPGWALFVYPNTVLLSFVSGLLCRSAGAASACGLLWASADVAATVVVGDAGLRAAIEPALAYLINPLIGWRGGSLLRRDEEHLAAALAADVRERAELAAAAQRWRLATALHDGVLQTLETLQRGSVLTDPSLHAEAADRAAWLRRYIEAGGEDRGADLGADLDAAVAAARQAGIVVEMNAAQLHAAEDVFEDPFEMAPGSGTASGTPATAPGPLLAEPQREAMLEALFQTISAFGTGGDGGGVVMVRAVPDRGGVFVTVLSTGAVTADSSDIADAGSKLASAGGWLKVTPTPCVELWVPGVE